MRNSIYEWHDSYMKNSPVILHRRICKKAGWHGGTNLHENIEFIVGFSGEGFVTCDDRKADVTAGDIVCINAYVAHDVHSVRAFSSQCLIVDSNFCRANGIDTTAMRFAEKLRDEKLFSLFKEIDRAHNSEECYAAVSLRGALLSFIAHLASNHLADGAHAAPPPESIQLAVSYMKANLGSAITLAALAHESGLSRTHFAHRFKETLGVPPLTYLNTLRMESACNLLAESNRPVAEIAAACGFDSPSYFARAFRHTFGVRPLRYRLMQKNGDAQ